MLAADEGRFSRLGEVASGGQVMRAWCPTGIRPVVGQQIVREYVYAYAAVAPPLGKMTALVLPYANTEMINIFLAQVSQEFRDYFLIMQVDGAAWHGSKSLVIPENIRLITQLAYSPELNPVEHLWSEIRTHHFYNQVFDSIDSVMDKLCQGLNELISAPEKLRSMTYFPHLRMVF